MRRIAPLMILALIVGCGTTTDVEPPRWSATLVAEAEFPGVSGSATAETVLGQTVVTATLVGATPGAEHPWHIHFGTCDNDEGIFGDPAAYPHLQVGAAGQATAMATLVATLQAGASYFINIHASEEDLATIVACGELTRQ